MQYFCYSLIASVVIITFSVTSFLIGVYHIIMFIRLLKLFYLAAWIPGPKNYVCLSKFMFSACVRLPVPKCSVFYCQTVHNSECVVALAWLLHHPAQSHCTRWRWEDLNSTAHHQTEAHHAARWRRTFSRTWVVLLGLHSWYVYHCAWISQYLFFQTDGVTPWVWWCHECYRL
jgi:hypothetical protein